MASPAFGPITVALVRELAQCETSEVALVAEHQASVYRSWKRRMNEVMARLQQVQNLDEGPHSVLHLRSTLVAVSP